MPKTTPREETASVGSQKANVHLEKHARFKHDPNKKGTGKGRLRSLSPTVSPHRNAKGVGEK